jgi:hypothetical protein
MVYRTFRFYILDKERFRESRDISQSGTILDVSKYPRVRKTGCRYTIEELEELNQALRKVRIVSY